MALPTAGKGGPLGRDDRRAVEPTPARPTPEPATARTVMPVAGPGTPLRSESTRPTETAEDFRVAETEVRDRVEPVPHVVQQGENFWSISQLYYGTARYYIALWSANRAAVPDIDKLTVGQTIRIPPPEALDRGLVAQAQARIAAASRGATRPAAGTTSRSSGTPTPTTAPRPTPAAKPGEIEVALPTTDPFTRRRAEPENAGGEEPVVGPAVKPRRPRYRVHARETLRSIARKTLGDSHRADEILELNAEAIDDPNHLIEGQILELPDDASDGTDRRTR